MKHIFLLGRLLFSIVFIIKGIGHFCPKMIERVAETGVPMAHFLVPLWGVVALVGGLSLLLGYKAKIGAWMLVVFLIPVTFMIHTYWDKEAGMLARMDMLCFWKNISLIGALLMLAYTGSGPYSVKRS